MNNITFGNLRKTISVTDRISICDRKTLKYWNFLSIQDVPRRYNSLYVYGVGMIESEFYQVNEYEYSTKEGSGSLVLVPCLEIVTSKQPLSKMMTTREKKQLEDTERVDKKIRAAGSYLIQKHIGALNELSHEPSHVRTSPSTNRSDVRKKKLRDFLDED